MKKILILIMLFLCVVPSALSYMSSKDIYERIEMFADNIDDYMSYVSEEKRDMFTSWGLSNWVEKSISYRFYNKPRGINRTWIYLEGDCTDKAQLKKYMLDHIGIKSRLVAGYDSFGSKHDTLEYWYDDKWNQHEYGFEKVKNGIW